MDRRLMCSVVGAMLAVASCHMPARAQDASNDVYQAIVSREYGTAVRDMEAIEKILHDAKPADYPGIEKQFLKILETPGATVAGRQFTLRMLPFVASPRCVPVVARLLTDKELSHSARYVLRGLALKEADAALRAALADTQGATRIGIINTLGDRKDTAALKPLSALLKGADDDTARAIFNAMGRIGGPEAAATLEKIKPAEHLKSAWAMGCLSTAESIATAGDAKKAMQLYRRLIEPGVPSAVRVGALKVVLEVDKESAAPAIAQMLSSDDLLIKKAALSAVVQVPGHAATMEFVAQLSGLKPEPKALMVAQLAVRGDKEGVTPVVQKLVADKEPVVSAAAVQALSRLGEASSVGVMAPLLKDAATQDAAREALRALKADGVTEALIKLAGGGDTAVRAAVLNVLTDRRDSSALPAARKAAGDADADVRQAGLRMLSKFGGRDDLKPLCESLLAAGSDTERANLARAIQAVGLKVDDKATRTDEIAACFAKATAPAKEVLLPVLATLGGEKALATVRAAVGDGGAVHKAAVRALADWPDAGPIAELRKAAKEEGDVSVKISALRGFVRMVGLSGMNAGEKAASYREAMASATRPEEKLQILAEVGSMAHPDALKVAEACLADEKVKTEAFMAYEKIAEAVAGSQPAAASNALQKVVAETADEALRAKAKSALKNIK